jgi:hypothetical protein
LIRAPTIEELSSLSELCFRSKAVWGYDEEFLEACRSELSFDERGLQLTPIAVAEHGGKLVGVVQVKVIGDEADLPSALGRSQFPADASAWMKHAPTPSISAPSRLALDGADLPSPGGDPMAGCRRSSVMAYSARGSFCSIDVNQTMLSPLAGGRSFAAD